MAIADAGAHDGGGPGGLKIAWIASYAKSGNTWMRLFLSRLLVGEAWTIDHPTTFIPYLLTLVAPKRVYGAADLDDLETIREVASTWIPIQRRVLAAAVRDHRGALLIKTHNACAAVAGHPFTNADLSGRALHIVRDPRDVAISLAHHVDLPLDAVVGLMTKRTAFVLPDLNYMPEFWSDWAGHLASWRAFPFGPTHLLRYEDMRADPHAAFRGVVDFLGWADDAAAIDAAIAAVRFDRLQATEAEKRFIEAPGDRPFFRRGVAGGWRDHPDQHLFRRLEDAFAEPMTALGYQ